MKTPQARRHQKQTRAVESPKERLLRAGAEALYDAELLAVLLGTDSNAAADLLEQCGPTLPRVFEAGPAIFHSFSLTGQANVLAAIELSRRLAHAELPERDALKNPETLARFLALRYRTLDQEVVGILFLDSSMRVLGIEEVFRGTIHRASVEPRPLLRKALLLGAARFAIFHTHPSGDPTPSQEDIFFTRHLAEAAATVGLGLDDHLIVGEAGRWLSLRDRICF